MIALLIAAYLGIALLCTYLEGRLTGDAVPPVWLMWPFVLPIYALAFVFNAAGDLGEKHGK